MKREAHGDPDSNTLFVAQLFIHIRVFTLVNLDKQYYETEWQINMK